MPLPPYICLLASPNSKNVCFTSSIQDSSNSKLLGYFGSSIKKKDLHLSNRFWLSLKFFLFTRICLEHCIVFFNVEGIDIFIMNVIILQPVYVFYLIAAIRLLLCKEKLLHEEAWHF